MPLVKKDYYTPQEALALIARQLPDESAEKNLLSALESGKLPARIVYEKSDTAIAIPHELWRSKGRIEYSFANGIAKVEEMLIRGPAPKTNRFQGTWDDDGHYAPKYVTGKILIDREGFDALLRKVSEGISSMSNVTTSTDERENLARVSPEKRGRKPKYDWAAFQRAVTEIADKDSLPDTQSRLEGLMEEWCIDNWGDAPSMSRIREHVKDFYPRPYTKN